MTKKVGDQLHAGEDLIGGVFTIFLHNCSLMGNGHLYIDENPLKSLYKWVNCQNFGIYQMHTSSIVHSSSVLVSRCT